MSARARHHRLLQSCNREFAATRFLRWIPKTLAASENLTWFSLLDSLFTIIIQADLLRKSSSPIWGTLTCIKVFWMFDKLTFEYLIELVVALWKWAIGGGLEKSPFAHWCEFLGWLISNKSHCACKSSFVETWEFPYSPECPLQWHFFLRVPLSFSKPNTPSLTLYQRGDHDQFFGLSPQFLLHYTMQPCPPFSVWVVSPKMNA